MEQTWNTLLLRSDISFPHQTFLELQSCHRCVQQRRNQRGQSVIWDLVFTLPLLFLTGNDMICTFLGCAWMKIIEHHK
ncbi:hypothetical protein CesoFtcFv8_027182 [Champsocephalus esox]|uniref:Uncharacterized protein n=1 Tax=Champsocephalus esox TaxID=159716 RepID=A0AAN8GB23_9TELE|nr:hypothetical protein CesoFtcFv8_027182 [Champsocephalus esox]